MLRRRLGWFSAAALGFLSCTPRLPCSGERDLECILGKSAKCNRACAKVDALVWFSEQLCKIVAIAIRYNDKNMIVGSTQISAGESCTRRRNLAIAMIIQPVPLLASIPNSIQRVLSHPRRQTL